MRSALRLAGVLVCLLAAACIPRGSRPPLRELSTKGYGQCLADLRAQGVTFEPLKDRDFGNGCATRQTVKLVAIGTPVTNLGAMRCPLAAAFVRWTRDAQGIAQADLGTSIRRLESLGTFACRPVNNVAGNKLSEHAFANAVDIAALTLADGRRISVKADWNGPDARVRTFLRDLHKAGCRRFAIVLGPDANAFHADHFHFDMGTGPYCR